MSFFRGILLSVASIIVTLLTLELSLEIFMPQTKNTSWRIQDNLTGTFLNIKNGKGQHQYIGKTDKISVEYNFGKFHNRIYEDFKYVDEKKNILVLGDSHIFGWLLEDKDTLVYKLIDKFNNFNFINASAGGWSDIDSFNYLKKFCKKIKPKKIIFFLNIDRAINSKLMFFEDDELKIKNVEINQLKKKLNDFTIYNWLSRNSNLFQLTKNIYIQSSNKNFINYNQAQKQTNIKKIENIDLKLFSKLVDKITDEAKKCQSEVLFIDRGWELKKNNSKIKNDIFDYLEKKQDNNLINFISLYDDMNVVRKDKKKYLLEEGHGNNLGNEVMFKALSSKLKNLIN